MQAIALSKQYLYPVIYIDKPHSRALLVNPVRICQQKRNFILRNAHSVVWYRYDDILSHFLASDYYLSKIVQLSDSII